MKRILFFTLFVLCSLAAFGQQRTLITDRAVIRDSIQIGTKWIYLVSEDSTFSAADHRSVATTKAIKDYVDALTSGGSGVEDVFVSSDTLYIQTSDSTYSVLLPSPDSLIWATTSALADSVAGRPAGSGTTNFLAKWLSSTSLGNSLMSDDGARMTAGGMAGLVLPVGTTAQRSGAPLTGEGRVNSTNSNTLEWYTGTAWEVPIRSAFASGLGTATHVPFFDANGRIAGAANLTYINVHNRLLVGTTTSPNVTSSLVVGGHIETQTGGLIIRSSAAAVTASNVQGALYSNSADNNNLWLSARRTFANPSGVDIVFATGSDSHVSRMRIFGQKTGTGPDAEKTGGGVHLTNTANPVSHLDLYSLTNYADRIPFAVGNPNTAIQGKGYGSLFYQALNAAENNDTLHAIYHSPNFQQGAKTGVISRGFTYVPRNSTAIHYAATYGSGRIGLGTHFPSDTLHVVGTTRITASGGAATTLTGRDANNVITSVSLGTGLSLASGTLSASPVEQQYAHMYVLGSFTDTIHTTARKINRNQIGSTAGTATSQFVLDTTSIRFVGDGATVEISATWNGAVGSFGDNVRLYITKNGTKIASTEVLAFFSGGTIPQTLSMHPAIVSAANGDIFEVRAESVVNNLTYTTYLLNLTAKKL